MLERVSNEAPGESSSPKEVIVTIASGIGMLKTKLVNTTNKNKKMWRAMAKNTSTAEVSTPLQQELCEGAPAGASPARYNLRSTPTRQAAAAASSSVHVPRKRNSKVVASEESSSREKDVIETTGHDLTEVSHRVSATGGLSTESGGSETEDRTGTEQQEPSAGSTIPVPVTDLEQVQEMAQQLTALISNLKQKQSSHSV